MSSRVRGGGWFLAATIVLLLFGSVHVLAIYDSLYGKSEPGTPKARVDEALRAFKLDLGPFHATGFGTVMILNSSYSVLLLYVAILNLATWRCAAAAGRLRRLTVINMLFVALLGGICLAFQFPPPLLFAALALLLFIVSYVRQSAGSGDAAFAS